ncbi:SCP-2 sterol transfer family protein [Pseudoflavonifractor sp. AF19-9AC]|uniref:SCP2 sterol-binding domain-containing protein n=1 Tax=Pseudoflavonifractor sp. AF19-9AC TaxID=2292244 RepID=UPI000E4DB53C|nr:SCP2 sterol-binding domain-containing protein [Pseudoflavonifractor sp. AF19-9AC]RHR05688.1 SCP-2 sterol transfer family protein [Pseudoflavonifractor sp. AF19-9AC]
MTYEAMFQEVKTLLKRADASGIHEHLAYQFNITGEASGTFYLEVKDGTLAVEPYDYRDRDAAFTCSAETLFKIASGKTDPVAAVFMGKLKVEGSIDKALRLKELLPRGK